MYFSETEAHHEKLQQARDSRGEIKEQTSETKQLPLWRTC